MAVALAASLLLPAPASAMAINENLIMQENSYRYIEITRVGAGNGSDLAVGWEADRAVDVWIMTAGQFEDYTAKRPILFELEWNGTSGSVAYNVSEGRSQDEPFYFLIDNTARGVARPPAGDPEPTHVSLTGETRMNGYRAGGQYSDPGYEAAMDAALWIALIVPVALVSAFFAWRMQKKRRSRGPTPIRGAAAASPVNFCGFCGKPLVSGNAFCNQCGKPV
jgi:hypothetical protein